MEKISADLVFEKIMKEYSVLSYTIGAEQATDTLCKGHPEYEWCKSQILAWYTAQNDIWDVMLRMLMESRTESFDEEVFSD